MGEETDRVTEKMKQISPLPINLINYSPNVVNLTLIDLLGLTKVTIKRQPEDIVQEIENLVCSYVEWRVEKWGKRLWVSQRRQSFQRQEATIRAIGESFKGARLLCVHRELHQIRLT